MRIARTVPELAVAAIHRWRTWPDRLRLTGLDGRDIGVDLVAELTDGTLAAVQCKCYAETHTVGKKEIRLLPERLGGGVLRAPMDREHSEAGPKRGSSRRGSAAERFVDRFQALS